MSGVPESSWTGIGNELESHPDAGCLGCNFERIEMGDAVLEQLKAGLKASGLDFTKPPLTARAEFEAMLATIPVQEDIAFSTIELGGVPTLKATTPQAAADAALLYFHGGAYVVGSATGYRALAAELGRAAGVITYSVDYRLAPEHVFPAAVDDAVAAYKAVLDQGIAPGRVVIAGDSAGGGLVVALLVALRDAGLPAPAAALTISPWVDLTCSGSTIATKAAVDPSLTPEGLVAMAGHYLAGGNTAQPLASPLFADLAGLPPLLIQVGSAEILLDDAIRLAGAAGAADVPVQLEVWPEVPHVWHAFAFMLPAGRAAIDQAGAFLKARLAPAG